MNLAGGMDEITPASSLERLFAVGIGTIIFVIALVMMGVFTSGLTQQYIIGGSGARQLATLKRYLKQNNVSKVITKRVCRNAKHAISGDLTPESVELLQVISEPLKVELAFETWTAIWQALKFQRQHAPHPRTCTLKFSCGSPSSSSCFQRTPQL